MRVAEGTRRDFLVSIRPQYAEKILEGAKTVELRRRFVEDVEEGALVLIYSSSPIQAIIGSATIREVRRLGIPKLWRLYGKAACIGRDAFDMYFEGREEGYAIVLQNVKPFDQALEVADLREKFGFVPPQSFMYLRREYYPLLKHERFQAPN